LQIKEKKDKVKHFFGFFQQKIVIGNKISTSQSCLSSKFQTKIKGIVRFQKQKKLDSFRYFFRFKFNVFLSMKFNQN